MRRSGFILLTSLIVIVFLTLAGTSLFVGGVSQSHTGLRTYSRSNALQLAEAGVNQAALNLQTATTTDDLGLAPVTLSAGSFTLDPAQSVGNGLTKVISTGTSQLEQRRIEAVFQLTPQSIFRFALFGDQGVTISGNALTDSYDSSKGPYNDTVGSPGYNADHHGDVGTNRTTVGGVTVSGSLFVDGQVAVGPGVSNPTSVVSGYNPIFITGGTSPPSDNQDVISQSTAFVMPSTSVPQGLTCKSLTVSGNSTVTLPTGGGTACVGTNCCFTTLKVSGGGKLTATGPVTVYLTNQLTASGNSVVGVANDPTKMTFLMTSISGATLEEGSITGSTKFYGALYGSMATIDITGNAEVYGSVIAQSVSVSGSAEVHRDTALGNNTTLSNLYKTKVVSWREL